MHTLPDKVPAEGIESALARYMTHRCEKTFQPDGSEHRGNQQRRSAASIAWGEFRRSMGPRYSRCSFESFEARDDRQAAAVEAVQAYCANFTEHRRNGSGLVLVGPAGTGKDHLAAAALLTIAQQHCATIKYSNGLALYEEFRELIRTGDSETELVAELVRPEVLLISDPAPPLGLATERQMSILLRIIDHRYRLLRPTCATMNVDDFSHAEKALSPQVAGRIKHGAIVVVCNWEAYRTAGEVIAQ